jgi:hypothetical protein
MKYLTDGQWRQTDRIPTTPGSSATLALHQLYWIIMTAWSKAHCDAQQREAGAISMFRVVES